MRITGISIICVVLLAALAFHAAPAPAQDSSDRAVTNHAPGQFYQAQGPFHHKRHNPFYRPMPKNKSEGHGGTHHSPRHHRRHPRQHFHHHYHYPAVPYYHPPVYYYQPRNYYFYRFGW